MREGRRGHNGGMGAVRRTAEKIKRAYRVLADSRYSTIAGMLVFFLVMSVVPLLFWLILLFGTRVLDSVPLEELAPFEGSERLIALLRDNAVSAGRGAGVLFLLTTLWSGSAFFYHLRRSGEMIYGFRRAKKGWRVRLSAILATFAVLLLLAVAGVLLFAAGVSSRLLPAWVSYPAFYSLLLALGFFGAWALNLYICPYRVPPSSLARGSFYTALLWLAASAVFSVYLHLADHERLYGVLAVFIVMLLWLYWMMIVFTAGVVYNRTRAEKTDRAPRRL